MKSSMKKTALVALLNAAAITSGSSLLALSAYGQDQQIAVEKKYAFNLHDYFGLNKPKYRFSDFYLDLRLCYPYVCIGCDLAGVDLGAMCKVKSLKDSDVFDSIMIGVKGSQGVYDGADFGPVNASNSDFRSSSFINVVLWETRFHNSDLSHSVISPAQAFNSEWHNANLTGATVSGDMDEASLLGADLTNTDFSSASMRGAKFNSSTVFNNTNVHGTDFRGADPANFTRFDNTDLVGMVGIPIVDSFVDWTDATCPDTTAANDNGTPATCQGHFVP